MQDTKFKSIGKGDIKENIALMSRLGFKGVEIAIRNPELVDIVELQSILDTHQLRLIAIGTGQAYVDEGLSLTDSRKTIRLETIKRFKKHIDIANIFGSQVVIGLIKGNLGKDKADREIKFEYFKDALFEVLDYACKKNVLLAIEPLNHYECDFFNTAEDVINFIKEIRYLNLKILLDTFHMNIEEKDICDTIKLSGNFLSHVHIADSNRKYPGAGHLDFAEIVETLELINYTDFLSGEILQYPDLTSAMQNYIFFMKELEK